MATSILAEAAEETMNLPIPPLAFGIVAISTFALLLLVTLAFRNVGRRH